MAAGDVSKSLLARVRTALDEATASTWLDSEIYSALTDGQREIINFVLLVYKQKLKINQQEVLPEVLRVLQGTPATGTGTTSLPSKFLYPLAIYTTTSNVLIRPEIGRGSLKVNTYLASSSAQPFCSLSASQIVFETSVAWTMEFLASPTNDIDASHDPTLTEIAYQAMVEYAIAFLLTKDENPLADSHYQRFFSLIQNLIY